jgi:hypothetical protein
MEIKVIRAWNEEDQDQDKFFIESMHNASVNLKNLKITVDGEYPSKSDISIIYHLNQL